MTKRLVDRAANVLVLAITMLVLLGTSGCFVNDKPLRTGLRPGVTVPARAAVLMFIDGVGNNSFEKRLAAGDLPNIRKYILDRGLRYQRAVTCMPSITYAATATMLTGLSPGRHGIVGNCWFDRYSMRYQSYKFIKTYRTAENDLAGQTIFERLHDQLTVSVQVATRRGVTREIDNWATSGISWFFGQYTNVDKLTAMRFDLIAEIANRTGHWPLLIFAYFPACDEVGHLYGAGSPKYAEAIRNADEQIGRICRGLELAGVFGNTLLVLATDHGHVSMRDGDGAVNVGRYLADHFGMRVTDERFDKPDYLDRYAFYDRYDVVAVPDAPRLLGLHLRGDGSHWYDRPRDVRPLELSTRGGRIAAEQLAEHLAQMPYARFVAVRAGQDTVLLIGRGGKALVRRLQGHDEAGADTAGQVEDDRFSYRVLQGADPLNLHVQGLAGTGDSSQPPEQVLSLRQWLAATIDSENPGTVPQIVSYFGSPRSGDIVIFADPGYGFAPNRSGHGSTTPQEMRIPLVFAGPGVCRGVTQEPARLESVMPTIMTYLGLSDRLGGPGPLHGQPLELTADNVTK
jgi:arylsulfatase A-like enzyme